MFIRRNLAVRFRASS